MTTNGHAALAARNLTVRYGKLTAIEGIDFDVAPGSVYALLGRNGAGKSSLIRCLLGFQKPDQGQALVFGREVWRERASLMKRVAFVPEEPDAPPEMTAAEIVRFCGRLYEGWNDREAMENLNRLHIPLKVQYGKLSKGQKRQVALAIALVVRPEILILDDPTLGLDVVARKQLFEELISDLADRGTTVFVTTHDLPGLEGIADRVGILRNGRMVLDEDLEQLKWRFRRIRYATPAAAATTAELEQLETVEVRRWAAGIEAVVANYSDTSLERFRASSGIRDLQVTPMSLEEIFIAISSDEQGAAS
ncbi:MAG TPA: ABC transporter ATP-binding protein [Thermoanaerobaculia bacterium]|nr:ABC transporter ATP-binding protein [Thermoanaerobaculia bacterium]